MDQSGEKMLLSLLCGEGRKLINFKLLPGDNPTSGDALCRTAYAWLSQALKRTDEPDDLPKESLRQLAFDEALACI